ncbi:MAG: hypothetical protein AAGD92_01825 [Pseudomonadota bacterium]
MISDPAPLQTKTPLAAKRKRQQGFSVLEALAAIALIAAAFLPLLALQGQLARTVIATERAETRLAHKQSALNYLRVLNPTLQPQGTEVFGDAQLSWTARPISDEKPALGNGGEPGRFNIRLYEIDARITYADGRETTFSIRSMGWIPTAPVSIDAQ